MKVRGTSFRTAARQLSGLRERAGADSFGENKTTSGDIDRNRLARHRK